MVHISERPTLPRRTTLSTLTRKLRTLGPIAGAALRAAIAMEVAWVVVAPVEHLRSHTVLDAVEAPAVGHQDHFSGSHALAQESEDSASDPACAICLLFAVNGFAHESAPPAAPVAAEAWRSHLPPIARTTVDAPVGLTQARAPPSV